MILDSLFSVVGSPKKKYSRFNSVIIGQTDLSIKSLRILFHLMRVLLLVIADLVSMDAEHYALICISWHYHHLILINFSMIFL